MTTLNENLSFEILEHWYKTSREHIADLEENELSMGAEIHYLHSFIERKNLSDEFKYFKENAHEEFNDEHPFPKLTL